MRLFDYIIYSATFKRILYITFIFIAILLISNRVFDYFWRYESMNPKVNLKLLNKELLCIEGNQKFTIISRNKDYDFYDTVKIMKPTDEFDYINKIFIRFQHSNLIDSIFFVVSKTPEADIFWNQIFRSSVEINFLNKFSHKPDDFRTDYSKLVNHELLLDNDTLLKQAIFYFNENEKKLGLAECGTNSRIFKFICDKYLLPCKIITLQGGNAEEDGYNDRIGYPLHVVCELYSSKYKKWFVLDPTYGSVFLDSQIPLNAVEISNRVYFKREHDIARDSVLTTGRLELHNGYYRYYQNIYFKVNKPGFMEIQFLNSFFSNYRYGILLHTNCMPEFKTAKIYGGVKSLMYLLILIVFFIAIFTVVSFRLLNLARKK
jgi:hypothetical protein